MSVKYFCDQCCEELKHDNDHKRIKRVLGRVRIEIYTAVDDCWNKGNICRKCIEKTVKDGIDFV